ncbi:hypothetical protein ACKC9G_15485 [Pokkaliibacter sp. CJK22405]|uniref:hypothetical protein n=1 Tax=Pokkaliibacter sp. CJK22405 TaxID=3384615 RepID=UPI003984A85C
MNALQRWSHTGVSLALAMTISLWMSIADAAPLQWQRLREGHMLIQVSQDDQLHLSWSPAWQADANEEHLYVLGNQGQLMQELVIPASSVQGNRIVALPAKDSPYTLVIPGYSFRSYQVATKSGQLQFEPAKLHVSLYARDGESLYFRQPAGVPVRLGGKYQQGVTGFQVKSLGNQASQQLRLQQHTRYSDSDSLTLPASNKETLWQLTFEGNGKAGFWLDGAANRFANNPQALFVPESQPGAATINVSAQVTGKLPLLGLGMPYHQLPAASYQQIRETGPRLAGLYSFVDLMAENPRREDAMRQQMQQLGMENSVTLLAGSRRQAYLQADSTTQRALHAWLEATKRLPKDGLHYLGLADEPNLNYPEYETFARYFTTLAAMVDDDARAAGVRLIAPASSRWINGPLSDNAAQRRGIDWAQRLLAEHGREIDAVAWHSWMIRDPLDTRRYRQQVNSAADLVGRDSRGQPAKTLLLDQTNIGSGSTLSPYEQNSYFAALWWTSVVINASRDGLLGGLNWFLAADEEGYPKGMLTPHTDGTSTLKPVGAAQVFIHNHWLEQALFVDNPAFEVDVLPMRSDDGQRFSVLGANKANRTQHLNLSLPACNDGTAVTLSALAPSQQDMTLASATPVTTQALQCVAGHVQLTIAPYQLFALGWEANP